MLHTIVFLLTLVAALAFAQDEPLPCTPAAPTAVFEPATQNITPDTVASLTLHITNNDTGNCKPRSIGFLSVGLGSSGTGKYYPSPKLAYGYPDNNSVVAGSSTDIPFNYTINGTITPIAYYIPVVKLNVGDTTLITQALLVYPEEPPVCLPYSVHETICHLLGCEEGTEPY